MLKLVNTKEFLTNFDLRQIDQKDALAENDRILIGTTEGNQAISVKDFYFALLDEVFRHRDEVPRAIARKMFFRGKDLGDHVTESQWSAIESSGYFGLFVGDYWTINGTKYVIMDIDYWTRSYVVGPHLVIMPDPYLYNTDVIISDNISTGYVGSKVYTNYIPNTVIPKIKYDFGEGHIIDVLDTFSNVINTTNGAVEGIQWITTKASLPTPEMLFGHCLNGYKMTNARANTQLAACMIDNHSINPAQTSFWLRDSVIANEWTIADGNTKVSTLKITNATKVRPVFGIR